MDVDRLRAAGAALRLTHPAPGVADVPRVDVSAGVVVAVIAAAVRGGVCVGAFLLAVALGGNFALGFFAAEVSEVSGLGVDLLLFFVRAHSRVIIGRHGGDGGVSGWVVERALLELCLGWLDLGGLDGDLVWIGVIVWGLYFSTL